MSDGALDAVRETFAQPEGLILITGPTGAGKTMTLYSLASFLDLESMIAISVEDPVEYDLPNIRQIQADPEHGMAIPAALKAMLRMDPDILLVGEIRDAQSAQTAVRAAASGRFVLATLHAREIGLALETCHHYSVPRHLLGSTLRLVTSQALVRRVCGACAGKREPTDAEAGQFQDRGLDVPDHLPVPKGCGACHDFGYSGRVGVFEVVQIDRETGRRLSQRRVAENMREALDRTEKTSLPREALQKVAAGVTTMEEIHHLYVPGHLGAGDDEPLTGTTPRDTV